jgi:phosphoribosylformimino-5-aminoimidazole carboxamide ribotide isomerase
MGVPRLHVVDLDGAAIGEPSNLDIIEQMASAILVPIQVGGGIRRMEAVKALLKAGIERIVLGTAAVEDARLVEEACRSYRESIVVSLDARDGCISTHGWQKETDLKAVEFAGSLVRKGVSRFVYTDISRDGTLTEPNAAAIYELVDAIRVPVIASGGISSLNHLKMLKQLGVEGAIIGKALYTGDINLKQALAAVT